MKLKHKNEKAMGNEKNNNKKQKIQSNKREKDLKDK